MCEAFTFPEYKELSTRQQQAICSLLEEFAGHVIGEVEIWHIEEELELWTECLRGFCLPNWCIDYDWKDRVGKKFALLVQAAAKIAKNVGAWRVVVDARDPADVNVVLLEENSPQAVILWKRIDAYDTQYPNLAALGEAILALTGEISDVLHSVSIGRYATNEIPGMESGSTG
jgi:hypothetical protein